jgi:hypothetical protein
MTSKEHTLIVHMFARQTILIKSILEMLKSRDVLEDDDVAAFEALVRETEHQDREILHATVNQYTKYAEGLGLGDDLPKPKTH